MTAALGIYGAGRWVDRLKGSLGAPGAPPVHCLDMRELDRQLRDLFGDGLTGAFSAARGRWLRVRLGHARTAGAPALVLGVHDGDDVELLRSEGVRVVAVAGDQVADDLDVTTLMHQVPVECLLNQAAIESYVASALWPEPPEHRMLSAQMALLYPRRDSETGCAVLHSIYATEGEAVALVYLTVPELELALVTAATAPPLWARTVDAPAAVALRELLASVAAVRATPLRTLEPAIGTVKALRPRFDPTGAPAAPGPPQAAAIADLIEVDAMRLGDLDLGLDADEAADEAGPWELAGVLGSTPQEGWAAAHDDALGRRFPPRAPPPPRPCALGPRCRGRGDPAVAYVCVTCGPVCAACAEAAVLAHGDALAVPGAAAGAPWTVMCPGAGCDQAVWGEKLRPKLPASSSAHSVLASIDHMMLAAAASSGSQSSASSPK